MVRRSLVVVASVAVLVTAATVEAKRPPGPPPGGGGGGGPSELVISGSVSGLYPGLVVELPVKLESPFNFAILVQTFRVEVGDAGPQCSAENVEVGPTPESILIAARGEVTVPIALTLARDAADACQDATFPLSYEAQAVRA